MNASDILLSMLFILRLAKITILLRFFFLSVVDFNSFFTIHVKIKNPRVKLALAIFTVAPLTVANNAIKVLLVILDKTVNYLSK